MSVSEEYLRQHFHSGRVENGINAEAIVAAGRRRLRARRQRTVGLTAAVGVAVAIAAAGGSLQSGPGGAEFELVGAGLTLASGSSGPVQVSDDRVDFGHGLQAWRQGRTLQVGYPNGTHASLDTTDPTAQWGDLGYDVITLDPEGEDDGVTAVVGTVQGEPTRVEVSIAGVSKTATIACFTEARGWCSYAALVPFSVQNYAAQPTVVSVS